MKIIFICTRSITFNTFLKSQAVYFIKKGLDVEVACSDSENINVKNNLRVKQLGQDILHISLEKK